MNVNEALPNIFNFLIPRYRILLSTLSKEFNNIFWYKPVNKTVIINNQTRYERFIGWCHEKRPHITHLKFGLYFDNPLIFLPETLTHLEFEQYNTVGMLSGGSFKHPLENLPHGLTHLYLNSLYNHPLINLPSTLKVLHVGTEFNSQMTLPDGLEELNISSYKELVLHRLPSRLKSFAMGYNTELTCKIPDSVEKMQLYNSCHFPPTVKELVITWGWNPDIRLHHGLTKLIFSGTFNQDLPDLPDTLTYIWLGSIHFNRPVKNLPKNLKTLILGDKFNKSLNFLPNTVEHLEVGYKFNMKITRYPKNLRYLKLGDAYNHPIDNLPEGLRRLRLGRDFSQSVDNLPESLTHLRLGWYTGTFYNLPRNLEVLTFKGHVRQELRDLPPNLYALKVDLGCTTRVFDKLPPKLRYLRILNTYGDTFPSSIVFLVRDTPKKYTFRN